MRSSLGGCGRSRTSPCATPLEAVDAVALGCRLLDPGVGGMAAQQTPSASPAREDRVVNSLPHAFAAHVGDDELRVLAPQLLLLSRELTCAPPLTQQRAPAHVLLPGDV